MLRLMEEHAVWRCQGRERLLDRMGGLYGGVVFHVTFFYMAGRSPERGLQRVVAVEQHDLITLRQEANYGQLIEPGSQGRRAAHWYVICGAP